MAIYALGAQVPDIDPTAYVHPGATVIGDVRIGPQASIWPNAVLRGDYGSITIGARTNIQDGAVIHTTAIMPTTVGDDVVVGHLAHLECCHVIGHALVGTGSIVLHRAVVERDALVGAGAVVPNDMVVPSLAMALGVPAKLRSDTVDPDEIDRLVGIYLANGERYRKELRRLD
jgi:carbonic anhydrase/acetyltransferase-like protein (isoleucine patch superfamily)